MNRIRERSKGRAGVYAIVNLDDGYGTAYVGSSVKLWERWISHKSRLRRNKHVNLHLQSACNRYGIEAFAFHVLEIIDSNVELVELEQYWLSSFRKTGRVYNVGECAIAPMTGRKHTKAARQRMSDALKGRKCSKEARERMSKAQRSKYLSEEARRRMGDAMRGKPKTFSTETRRKISEAAKIRMSDPRAREHLSIVNSRPHPALQHKETGAIISSGIGLQRMCRERGLSASAVCCMIKGRLKSHKGWTLIDEALP